MPHDPNNETWGEVLLDACMFITSVALLGVLVYALVMAH